MPMFGRRPRYDDTYGVRMDFGGDRKDPLSLRTVRPLFDYAKPVVLIETPRSIFDVFGRRADDTFVDTRFPKAAPASMPAVAAARALRPKPPAAGRAAAPLTGARAPVSLEGGIAALWKQLPLQLKIIAIVGGGWFLIASGLFVPAIVIGVVYLSQRKKKT